jgi:hypothetical protein
MIDPSSVDSATEHLQELQLWQTTCELIPAKNRFGVLNATRDLLKELSWHAIYEFLGSVLDRPAHLLVLQLLRAQETDLRQCSHSHFFY